MGFFFYCGMKKIIVKKFNVKKNKCEKIFNKFYENVLFKQDIFFSFLQIPKNIFFIKKNFSKTQYKGPFVIRILRFSIVNLHR